MPDVEDITPELLALQEQWETLKTSYQQPVLSPEILRSPTAQHDFKLTTLLKTFQAKEAMNNHSAEHLMRYTNTAPSTESPKVDAIVHELSESIQKLTQLMHEREELAQTVIHRYRLVAPNSSHMQELQLCYNEAVSHIKSKLEYFLMTFTVLQLNEKNDPDTAHFKKEIIEFIEQWLAEFDKLPIHHPTLKNLRKQLLSHLGEKTAWHDLTKKTRSLDSDTVPLIIPNLFILTQKTPVTAENIKQQIAAFYHLAAKIEAFPIKNIKDYNVYKVHVDKTNQRIHAHYSNQFKTIDELLEALSSQVQLFDANKDYLEEAATCQHAVQELKARLIEHPHAYNQQRQCFAEEPSPLKRMENITQLQNDTTESLEKFDQEIHDLQESSDEILHMLHQKYIEERDALCQRLIAAIHSASEAFLVDGLTSEAIAERLRPQQTLYHDINNTEELPIPILATKVRQAIDHLYDIETDTIHRVGNQMRSRVGQAKNGYTASLPTLLHDNPFNNDLNRQHLLTHQAIQNTNAALEDLLQARGSDLHWKKNTVVLHCNELPPLIAEHESILRNACEANRRLETLTYQTSLTVIDALKAEYERIVHKKMHQDPMEGPHQHDETELMACLNHETLSAEHRQRLDALDPRLHKLWIINAAFKKTNDDYIHLRMQNDDTYSTTLLSKVNENIHHDHMEDLSDGKRTKFIQWIRIHVLKPLHQLSHQVSTLLYRMPHSSNHRFFTTPLACETEAKLIDVGNRVYEQLLRPNGG